MNDVNPRLAIGDNNPPPDDDAFLIERAAELIVAADAWTTIENADAAARLGDFIAQLRESASDLDKAEDKEKRPLMVAVDAIRARFRRPRDGIKLALERSRALANGWLDRERRRLAAEKAEADRQAELARQEAERQIAAANESGSVKDELAAREAMAEADKLAETTEKMATRPQIRADLSGKAISQTTRWSAEIVDARKARQHFLKNTEAVAAFDEAILRVARKMAVATKDPAKAPPGILFVKNVSA